MQQTIETARRLLGANSAMRADGLTVFGLAQDEESERARCEAGSRGRLVIRRSLD
jgi:hypothetical protein